MRAHRLREVALAACVTLLVTSPAAAQNGDTVETKVTAEVGVILLEWSKKHPWDAEMQSRGAALVAEYRTRTRGIVSEVLRTVATSRGREDRTLRFQLPDAVASPPIGPVCLYFQLPARKLLPVRRANSQGTETSRFRYEAWEQAATKHIEAVVLRANTDLTKRKVAVNAQDVATQDAIVARGFGRTLEACETVPTPSLSAVEKPFDVLPLEQHDNVARQVCIMRARNGEIVEDFSLVQGPALLETLFNLIPEPLISSDPNLGERRRQLVQFRQDWDRWAPAVPQYRAQFPTPHFGDRYDVLSLQTTNGRAAAALLEKRPPDPADIPGYVGGTLEAYFRCVTDGTKQLATKYASWQALAASSPLRSTLARQQLVAACQREVTKLDQLKGDGVALRRQLELDDKALTAALVVQPLPTKSQNLNARSCSLQ